MAKMFMYHSVIPENNKASFTEYDNVDMMMTFEGRSLNLNSVRLEGVLNVTHDGTALSTTANEAKDIRFDKLVGGHSFIESIQTSFQTGGLIENLNEYPRLVKSMVSATEGVDSMNNASNVCQLKAPTGEMTNLLMKGVSVENQLTTAIRSDPDFSIKPKFCLNSAIGDHLPYAKSGAIRVSFNLARVFACLYGLDVASTTAYSISDLRLTFTSVPEMAEHMDRTIVMNTILNLKQSVQSSLANIQTKVPAICRGVTISFLKQTSENVARDNNLQLEKVEGLNEVQYLFNDSTNSLISYILRDYEEVISRALESVYDSGKNNATMNALADNMGFLAGLDFGGMVDLRSQKFGFQIDSAIIPSSAMIAFMYFHSQVVV
tara:strand:- start:2194 stop:3324 length:1131 start_codon:yes stop_codon:yes gene_type:complete